MLEEGTLLVPTSYLLPTCSNLPKVPTTVSHSKFTICLRRWESFVHQKKQTGFFHMIIYLGLPLLGFSADMSPIMSLVLLWLSNLGAPNPGTLTQAFR